MTTEEKARRYDEAIERAKELSKTTTGANYEYIFPELKENEDEEIIKEIISIVKSYRESCITEGNHRFDNCIAWLEKQVEQEPTDEEMKESLRTEYEKGRADAIAEIQKLVDCTDCTNSKGCINCEDGNMKETLVQKTAWSEEDETIADNLAWAIANDKIRPQDRDDYCDWLKSLKDRYTWKPSDEQMKALNYVAYHLLNRHNGIKYDGLV